jgi:hypothetical protein
VDIRTSGAVDGGTQSRFRHQAETKAERHSYAETGEEAIHPRWRGDFLLDSPTTRATSTVKKTPKSRRANPRKQTKPPVQGYFIIFPPLQNLWVDLMTVEERREIDAFEFPFDDPVLLKRQMTKWRKAWNRICKRVGYSPGFRKIYDDGHRRVTGFFPD